MPYNLIYAFDEWDYGVRRQRNVRAAPQPLLVDSRPLIDDFKSQFPEPDFVNPHFLTVQERVLGPDQHKSLTQRDPDSGPMTRKRRRELEEKNPSDKRFKPYAYMCHYKYVDVHPLYLDFRTNLPFNVDSPNVYFIYADEENPYFIDV